LKDNKKHYGCSIAKETGAVIMAHFTIARAWQKYRGQLAIGLSVEDEKARRHAFFTGAAQLYANLLNELSADPEPTEDEVRMMDCLRFELMSFDEESGTTYTIPKLMMQ
jgi:hypothetical protein